MHPRSFRLLVLLVVLPVLPLSGCGTTQTNLVTGESQRGAYTWPEEVQLGREADQQITAQYGLYDDARLTAYVERIGQAVLRTSAYSDPNVTPAEIRNTPFHFRVLDSPVVNAFALPGGYIYVTRGLLAHADNEAQLAVVLGHEIGHVLARHASRRAASAQLGQLGLFGAAILGGVLGGGNVAEGILNYGGVGVQLLFLRYSREDEREADRAGVAYAEFADYDAAQAADFFDTLERLSQQSESGIPSFLSTHPDPAEREQTIPQLAAQYDPQGTEVNADPFLDAIEGIILGDDPAQGYTEGSRFYHPELRFQFEVPSGWAVNNTPAAVVIQEPGGQAVLEFTFAQGSTAQEAARQFAAQQGVQIADQRNASVGGNNAVSLRGAANTQQGAVAFLTYFIEYGGNVYRFMGLTGANTFDRFGSTFNRAITSFERLSDPRYLNREPVRLAVARADRSAPFSSFLRGRPTPQGMSEEELAILNGVQLSAQVPSGAALKLPR
jgi:predicted Zn-dependent protease